MKQPKLFFIILLIVVYSCKKKKQTVTEKIVNGIEHDTTKLYQKINIVYGEENTNSEEYEVYISKKKDTFWNQWKFYKNGVIDSSKSKFYDLKVEGIEGDSILKGTISFYSPADSIPDSNIHSREVNFVYLQKINDSLIYKEIRSNKSVINFDYQNYENFSFVGFIEDIRFFYKDSVPEELLLNRNDFAIDTEISTDNPFVDLLK